MNPVCHSQSSNVNQGNNVVLNSHCSAPTNLNTKVPYPPCNEVYRKTVQYTLFRVEDPWA